MATQITNQATLSFNSGGTNREVASNTASVTLQGPLEITKRSLEPAYHIAEELTYVLTVRNTSPSTLTNIEIRDNLGTHEITKDLKVTPLTYVGPTDVYLNNAYSSTITPIIPTEADYLDYQIASLAGNSSLMLIHKVRTNNFAGAIVNTSSIENTASVSAYGVTTPVDASHTIPVAAYADVVITKTMEPNPVVDGSTLTYTFKIENYGTISATNMTLLDTFSTIPSITSVMVNNVLIPTSDYDYNLGTFTYPGAAAISTFSIPAATFIQNADGTVSITPSQSTVIIQGTI